MKNGRLNRNLVHSTQKGNWRSLNAGAPLLNDHKILKIYTMKKGKTILAGTMLASALVMQGTVSDAQTALQPTCNHFLYWKLLL